MIKLLAVVEGGVGLRSRVIRREEALLAIESGEIVPLVVPPVLAGNRRRLAFKPLLQLYILGTQKITRFRSSLQSTALFFGPEQERSRCSKPPGSTRSDT